MDKIRLGNVGLLVLGFVILSVAGQDSNSTTTAPTPPTTASTAPPTTAKPTTAAPPTPLPTPAPKFPDNEGKWIVKNNATNVTCIMMQGALELSIIYTNTTNHTAIANIDIPKIANSSGNCNESWIKLDWEKNSLQFDFEANEAGNSTGGSGITPGKYALQNVVGTLFLSEANATINFEIKNKAAFQTPLNHSYSCLAQEELKDDKNNTLKFSGLHVEAFMMGPPGSSVFSAAIECPADDASDTVPIAVGAALAGLVVIVLIAYLIGRRRSRSRGYVSV